MVAKKNTQMVILASRSPRRIELLKQVGIDCIVLPSDVDESVLQDESPVDYVKRLAHKKVLVTANSMKREYSHLCVLAADTTVSLQGEILGKPENDADAFEMLKKLSAKKHEVHTAVAVSFHGNTKVMLSSTNVEMMRLTEDMINTYITSAEHRDKAGSYGIQGRAAAWVKHIEGSYSGVMGLPLFETVQLINKITST
ncbi:MAG: Maf family protein [Methylophilaceae bacterium]